MTMAPRKRDDRDEDDGSEHDGDEWQHVPPPSLPKTVTDMWERKRRIAESKKAAERMGAEVLESLREYGERLKYAPKDYDLGR